MIPIMNVEGILGYLQEVNFGFFKFRKLPKLVGNKIHIPIVMPNGINKTIITDKERFTKIDDKGYMIYPSLSDTSSNSKFKGNPR